MELKGAEHGLIFVGLVLDLLASTMDIGNRLSAGTVFGQEICGVMFTS